MLYFSEFANSEHLDADDDNDEHDWKMLMMTTTDNEWFIACPGVRK